MAGEGEDPNGESTTQEAGVASTAAASETANGNAQLHGIQNIQIQWPTHPGEYGVSGAKKHKKWKQTVRNIMRLRKIKEDDAALYIMMNTSGHATTLLEYLEEDEATYEKIMKTLENAFKGDDDEKAEESARVFHATARRHSEPMTEYLLRLEYNLNDYLKKESGSAVAPRAYAKQMLSRAGLSRSDQQQCFAFCEGEYDPELIKARLQTTYKDVHRNDHSAIRKGKNFRRGHHKTWVAGLEMNPSDVESDSEPEVCPICGMVHSPSPPDSYGEESEEEVRRDDEPEREPSPSV